MSSDNNTSYFGIDILGSVRNVTDKYGTVQADYSYDVFGSPYLGNLENDIGFGYCGKIYDNGTGLYDYGFRDYSPVSARFTTIDPIRDGANWFVYVVNDPVNYVDLWGLCGMDPKIQNALKDIIASSTDSYAASDIVHPDIIADNFVNNQQYLDNYSQAFLTSQGANAKNAVASVVKNTTVYVGVSRDVAQASAKEVGADVDMSTANGFSVGNSIFMFDKGRPTADMVQHELVHSLQAKALGGVENFLAIYANEGAAAIGRGEDEYYGNKMEKAGYSFGPSNRNATTNLTKSNTYIDYSGNVKESR